MLFLFLQRNVVNHIFGKIQFLGGLLYRILAAETLCYQLGYTGGGIGFGSGFFFFGGSTGYHQDEFTLGRIDGVLFHSLAQGGSDNLFVELGQLPAQTDGAVIAEGFGQILQGGQQLVGSFVEDHGALLFFQALQMLPSAFLCGGKEALEAEAAGCLSGDAQCGNGSTGAGNGTDLDTGSGALLYKILTGIGNGGAACVRHQGAGFTGQNPLCNFIALEGLVMPL